MAAQLSTGQPGLPVVGRRPLAQLLVDSVLSTPAVELPEGLRDIPVAEVVAAAEHHRVAPAVFRYVRDLPGTPAEWLGPLGFLRHEQLMRHLRAVQDAGLAGRVLDERGIAWMAVKGPLLAESIWPAVDMRQYLDLDLVVERRHFARALAALAEAGGQLLDRNWPLLKSTMRAEVAMTAAYGSPLDLHWDIAVPKDLRRAFRPDIAGMLARSRPVTIGPKVIVRAPDPVDTVLHLLFHAAQAGANRLVWLADVRFAVDQPGFSWLELAYRARAIRFEVPAAMVLARVGMTLGFTTPPPAAVLAPARGIWGRLATLRDARAPFPGLPGDPHQGGNIYSGARRQLWNSAYTTAKSHVYTRRIEAGLDKDPTVGDRPLRRDRPDEAAKSTYLRTTQFNESP